MLHEKFQSNVEKATVSLPKLGGQGVLVEGGFILTAAHCIAWKCDGSMVLGDHFIEDISTSLGILKVSPLAVEPVNDIAVLGSLDSQTFFSEADEFEKFCENTDAVPLCLSNFELFQPFPVYVRTHKQEWVKGDAQQCYEHAPSLWVETDDQIEGGTSGGPIINEAGELVGISSNFCVVADSQQKCNGSVPRPHLALPAWVVNDIARHSTPCITCDPVGELTVDSVGELTAAQNPQGKKITVG